jgi:hypothetical protein
MKHVGRWRPGSGGGAHKGSMLATGRGLPSIGTIMGLIPPAGENSEHVLLEAGREAKVG